MEFLSKNSFDFFKNSIISIDLGKKNIGIAYKIKNSSIIFPKDVFINDDKILEVLTSFIHAHDCKVIVIGDPKINDKSFGTQHVIEFAKKILKHVKIDIVLQDETMSSRRADDILHTFFTNDFQVKFENNQIRHKRQKAKNKTQSHHHLINFKQMKREVKDKDARAACVILERFMEFCEK